MIDVFWYSETEMPFNEFGYAPLGVRVLLQQKTPVPTSRFTHEGTTDDVSGQTIMLAKLQKPAILTHLRLSMQKQWTPSDSREVELVFPDFKGAGTYKNSEVGLSFTKGIQNSGWWKINTARQTTPDTQWQVVVTRVTPDVIEGTYSVQNAPISSKTGSLPAPASVTFSGSFSVIYPQ